MTPQQFEALQDAMEQAVADSDDYQTYGKPHGDYWRGMAGDGERAKAERGPVIAERLPGIVSVAEPGQTGVNRVRLRPPIEGNQPGPKKLRDKLQSLRAENALISA